MGLPQVHLGRKRAGAAGCHRIAKRSVALVAASAVVSTLVTGVITAPGMPQPRKAAAQTLNPRLCAGVPASSTFYHHGDEMRFDLYVPQNGTISLSGTVDLPNPDSVDWHVEPFVGPTAGGWMLGGTGPSDPHTNLAFSSTWTNTGPNAFIVIRPVWGNAGVGPLTWHLTVDAPAAPCTSPSNTKGSQCAGKHLDAAQSHRGDPVNTATGNLHEDLVDFSIPARGPGLALSHSYNSLGAAAPTANGPLGYGWTHSYAVSLAVDAAGVVTVTQEGGATLPFYPLAAGGFTAPPWAVATLVRNGDGSYTMTRCNAFTFLFAPTPTHELVSIADRNGHATTLQDVGGALSTVTDSAGRKLTFNWTGSHITSVSDRSGRSVSFGYNDGAGNLTDYSDVGGATWHYTYDNHRLATIRRPRQAGVPNPLVTTNVYDGQDRVLTQTDELGRPTRFDYTTIPNSTKITDPKLNVIVEEYHGGVRTKLTKGYQTAVEASWLFEYDGTAGVTKMTDPNGHVTRATYDLHGNALSVTDPLGHTTTATYTALDLPDTVTDPQGVMTRYTYDPYGNLTEERTPVDTTQGDRVVKYLYDTDPPIRGDLRTVTDANLKVWSKTYDPVTGYLATETDPLGHVTLYGYNAQDSDRGLLTSTVSSRGQAASVSPVCSPPALGCTAFGHDLWGRVTTTTDGNGHQSSVHYDPDGNLDYEIDADGNQTSYIHDPADQLTTVQRPGGTSLITDYWPDGSVKTTKDGAGQATNYAYDPQGRLTSSTDPTSRMTAYGYDPAGNIVSKADPGGTCPAWGSPWPPALSPTSGCTAMAYDAADRLVSVTYSDPSTPSVAAIGYDNDGRRTSLTQTLGGAAGAWGWDKIGRLTSATTGGSTVSYIYANPRDPATKVTYPGRGDVVRHFDDAGRLDSVTDWLQQKTDFKYDPASEVDLTEAKSPGGVGLGDAYGPYDNADQLGGVLDKANGVTAAGFTYTPDNAGQLQSVATTGLSDSHSYLYTGLNQLQKIDNAVAYAYDPADNLTAMPGVSSLTYTDANNNPNADRLRQATRGTGATIYGFDAKGANRTSASAAAGLVTNYAYDQANRLTSVDTTTWSPQISAGWYHSLAARADGTMTAWGLNNTGQVGDNSNVNRSSPTAVAGLTGVIAVAAGMSQSYALKNDGTVWAWGWNSHGQLGDNTIVDHWTAAPVPGLVNVVAIASGPSHALALKSDGTVWAWGYNPNGALGNGTVTESHVPVQVQGLTNVVAVSAGYTSSYALKSDGTVWAWGYNGYGQLGNNSTVDSLVPIQVSGLSGVAGISAGHYHVLALKSDGTVRAWGYNGAGALGNNTTVDSKTPIQVLGGLAAVTQIAAAGYTSWALKGDGTVAAWGNNANGQLGDGTTVNRLLPVTLTALAGTKGLTPGPAHGLALTSTQGAKAWGSNGAGQLGNGTLVDSSAPIAVSSAYNRGTAPKASYAYDGDGLRTRKTVAGTVTNYTWDSSGGVPLLIDDGTNAYLYGPDGLPFEQIGPGNAVTWLHHDRLGSTRVLTDSAGTVVGTATYDPYGRLTASYGKVGPLGFAGELTDAETGFVYLRARYYDPATGQFVSRDPLTAMTRSPYGYVYDNPLNFTDPNGLFALSAIGAVAGAVTGAVVNTVAYGAGCAAAHNCTVRGAAGAVIGGAAGGAIAGACIGTTGQVAACGAIGGETSYLLYSAVSGHRPTAKGAVVSAIVGALGNTIASWTGRGSGSYFGAPFPGNALSNTSGALGGLIGNALHGFGNGCDPTRNPDGSFTSGGQTPYMDPAGVPIPQ